MTRGNDNHKTTLYISKRKKIELEGTGDVGDRILEDTNIKRTSKQKDTAEYTERICADLCIMAMRDDLHFLAYLLDMARMEAFDRSKDDAPKPCKIII